MPRRIKHPQRYVFYVNGIAILDPHGDDVDRGLTAHHGYAAGLVAQFTEAGDVVGVTVRIDGLDQPKIEFIEQLNVTIDLFNNWIDDQRLASG